MIRILGFIGAALLAAPFVLARPAFSALGERELGLTGGTIYEGVCNVVKPCNSDTCLVSSGQCFRCVSVGDWQTCDNQDVFSCNINSITDCGLRYTCQIANLNPCQCINCSGSPVPCIRDSCIP